MCTVCCGTINSQDNRGRYSSGGCLVALKTVSQSGVSLLRGAVSNVWLDCDGVWIPRALLCCRTFWNFREEDRAEHELAGAAAGRDVAVRKVGKYNAAFKVFEVRYQPLTWSNSQIYGAFATSAYQLRTNAEATAAVVVLSFSESPSQVIFVSSSHYLLTTVVFPPFWTGIRPDSTTGESGEIFSWYNFKTRNVLARRGKSLPQDTGSGIYSINIGWRGEESSKITKGMKKTKLEKKNCVRFEFQ